MTNIIDSKYNHKEIEQKWNKIWQHNNYFKAEATPGKPYFSIALPPPNVTGSLHMGHAVNAAIQDTLIRWNRMKGISVLWLPGTDHAGIATQFVVEKKIKKEEGKSRHDLGREEFIKRVWEWKNEYGNTIIEQLKRLGASADYSRLRFTMDESYCKAVRKTFHEWFTRGLIYRGLRSVNWCTRCLTTLSDLEVEHETTLSKLYHIHYPGVDNEGVIVATTRPETMLGDVAVAVNPEDSRYKHLIGKKVILPLVNKEIPIIADEYVDKEFGTGSLKITPAHDPNDFEIGNRHNLEPVNVFNPDGTINENGIKYQGLTILQAKEAVIKDLQEQGLLKKIEDYENAIGHCYRCNSPIEPYLSTQWFVKMKDLAQKVIERTKNKEIQFIPERWTPLFINWLENVRDWCISRQLWWGHQIPVWYCNSCNQISSSMDDLTLCPNCQSNDIKRDEDVLDTWFSSALWPFATLGWPDNTPELEHFYPTSVLSTASEIINLWVARMAFSSLDLLNKIPFSHVLIHATILNKEGQRMSKSKGTGVDPLDIINQYGADSSRFWLSSVGMSGQDVKFSEEKIIQSRNFTTKIWNASRLIFLNLDGFNPDYKLEDQNLTLIDKWILSRLKELVQVVNTSMEKYNFTETARSIYEFFWDDFCDWYLEIAKPRLQTEEKNLVQYLSTFVLDKVLRLIHPFMPFISEELWENLKNCGLKAKEPHLIVAKWVQAEDLIYYDEKAKDDMNLIINIIRAIRNLRSEFSVPAAKIADNVFIVSQDEHKRDILKQGEKYILNLSRVNKLSLNPSVRPVSSVTSVIGDVEVILPVDDLIDIEKEKVRISKEIEKVTLQQERLIKQLNNTDFIAKASKEIVIKTGKQLEETEAQKLLLQKRLDLFTS